ncbi:sigma-54-dependent Fis family transcriptional regulator [candidate division WOR-3 bacterium]|nr:sigma-54-dependent Fis family transcriptional regulator [candidate division WOR-3 bacterium]
MRKRLDLVLADDDINYAKYTSKNIAERLKISVKFVCRVEDALKLIKAENPRLALIDIVFENDMRFPTGLHIVEKISSLVDTDFVILTGSDSIEQVFRAGQLAVKSVVRKSADITFLLSVIRELIDKSIEREKNQGSFALPRFIGISEKMSWIRKQIETAGKSDLPVLITGETGVGKDVTARLIHLNGSRKEKPFMVFDAGSVETSLVSKELFGNVKNAFTGAETATPGIFKEADKGTLFIDEIGNMSPEIQKYLLRALNKPQKIRPVGSSIEIGVDVRVILATNKDIKGLCRDGCFRNDLYARIDNPLRINIPPLRERRDDVPALFEHFLRNRAASGMKTPKFSKDAKDFLYRIYAWPMNVREVDQFVGGMGEKTEDNREFDLDTVLENLQILKSERVSEDKTEVNEGKSFEFFRDMTLKMAKEEMEFQSLKHHLEKNGYKTGLAAKSLGISRTHLFRLMKKHSKKLGITEDKMQDF